MGGSPKEEVLKAFGAYIFFDDKDIHLEGTSKYVPSAKDKSQINEKRILKYTLEYLPAN